MQDFSKFKPVCVDLLKTPSVENLTLLKHLLEQSQSGSLNELQEYILFPLFITLSNNTAITEKVVFKVGECLQILMKKSTLKVYKIFSDLLLQLLLLVYNINPEKKDKLQSEEIKFVAVHSVFYLLQSSTDEVVEELFAAANKPLLGHLVFTLLKVATYEEMKELRLSALDCLEELSCRNVTSFHSSMTDLYPGISSHMLKILNGEIKQSHVIPEKAVKVFSTITQLVLNNERLADESTIDTKWLQQTQANVHLIFEKMMNNPELHWKVKLQMITLTSQIVKDCSMTLEPSLPLLIKKLAQYTADENLEVQQKANEVVQSLGLAKVNFDSAVRQNLYDISTSFPRIISQGISRDQILILQELLGHLTLIGTRLEQSLMFSALRERLYKGLLVAATLEQAIVMEKEESYSLLYMRDDNVVKTFKSCCSSIGCFANLADTVDYYISVAKQNGLYKKEAVYVLIDIVKGAKKDVTVLSMLVEEYCNHLTQLESNDKDDVILGQLMLQSIGHTAKKMEDDFGPFLLCSLKPVLEKAGNCNFTTAAVAALESIALSQRCGTVKQLLEENSDYFAPQLSFQLRNIFRYPHAVDLLRALLLFSDIHMDQWLEHIVYQALRGLDKSHTLRALPYVQVLEMYCKAAQRGRPVTTAHGSTNSQTLSERITEFRKTIAASQCFDGDQEEEEPLHDTHEADTEPTVPKQVTVVAAILERCTKLLPQSQDDDLYATLMSAIRFSLDVLSSFENVFLPKVHELWAPLQHQLSSGCHLKQQQAFQVLMVLVRYCPEFLRHRIVAEVMPHLLVFLENQAAVSHGKRRQAHVMTQAYKFQKLLLKEAPALVQFLNLPVAQVSQILRIVCLYLSCYQLPELQVVAMESIESISKHNSGAVWAVLCCLVTKRCLSRPGLKSIEVGTSEEVNEYAINADELFAIIFQMK